MTIGIRSGIAVRALIAARQIMAASPTTIERHPGEGEGAYRTHHYHDLFAEQLGHSAAESHARIEKAFQQLFARRARHPMARNTT
jgi:oligosaccharide reducing-end xylanase